MRDTDGNREYRNEENLEEYLDTMKKTFIFGSHLVNFKLYNYSKTGCIYVFQQVFKSIQIENSEVSIPFNYNFLYKIDCQEKIKSLKVLNDNYIYAICSSGCVKIFRDEEFLKEIPFFKEKLELGVIIPTLDLLIVTDKKTMKIFDLKKFVKIVDLDLPLKNDKDKDSLNLVMSY